MLNYAQEGLGNLHASRFLVPAIRKCGREACSHIDELDQVESLTPGLDAVGEMVTRILAPLFWREDTELPPCSFDSLWIEFSLRHSEDWTGPLGRLSIQSSLGAEALPKSPDGVERCSIRREIDAHRPPLPEAPNTRVEAEPVPLLRADIQGNVHRIKPEQHNTPPEDGERDVFSEVFLKQVHTSMVALGMPLCIDLKPIDSSVSLCFLAGLNR